MGISLRNEWVDPLLSTQPRIPIVEVVFEQWVFASEPTLAKLEQLRARYPMLLHCLGMNLGSCDPLDKHYFELLRGFAGRFEVAGVSDHLSWRSVQGQWALSLLPMPRTEAALDHLCGRLDEVQSFLGREIALENISQYLPVPGDIPSAQMFNQLHQRCGTLIHLDLNNLLVTEKWLDESPGEFLDALTSDIAWVHVANHTEATQPVDDHCGVPSEACLSLLDRITPQVPVILEWDRDRPAFDDLVDSVSMKQAAVV